MLLVGFRAHVSAGRRTGRRKVHPGAVPNQVRERFAFFSAKWAVRPQGFAGGGHMRGQAEPPAQKASERTHVVIGERVGVLKVSEVSSPQSGRLAFRDEYPRPGHVNPPEGLASPVVPLGLVARSTGGQEDVQPEVNFFGRRSGPVQGEAEQVEPRTSPSRPQPPKQLQGIGPGTGRKPVGIHVGSPQGREPVRQRRVPQELLVELGDD